MSGAAMEPADFDFDLPERLIATRPVRPRRAARLLVAEGESIADSQVADLGQWLRPGDRLVLNDTKVVPARLKGTRTRPGAAGAGAAVEATLLAPEADGCWSAMAKPLKRLREGDALSFGAGLEARCEGRADGLARLRFNCDGDALSEALDQVGQMPLPPYISSRREPDERDREDYQSVFAANPGAVAAPTASLHFDSDLLAELQGAGVGATRVTLHVGAGTFLPVKAARVEDHKMHAEWGEIGEAAAAEIAQTRAAGGRIVAVGTTALRLLETAASGGAVAAWRGETDIFIRPGFRFRAVDALMTNFHLPRSTLMMLVSALMGRERMLRIYAHAVAREYRFFSYGDASLLIPG